MKFVSKFSYNANILFLELDVRYSGVCDIRVPEIFFKKRCVKGKRGIERLFCLCPYFYVVRQGPFLIITVLLQTKKLCLFTNKTMPAIFEVNAPKSIPFFSQCSNHTPMKLDQLQ